MFFSQIFRCRVSHYAKVSSTVVQRHFFFCLKILFHLLSSLHWCGVAFERLPVPISPDCNISCSKARAAALWNRQADPASSFPNRKYDEEEKSGRERPNFKRVYIGFHTTCRKCEQLTFDRSSILGPPHSDRSILISRVWPAEQQRRATVRLGPKLF